MDIYEKILKNGDLELSIFFDDGEREDLLNEYSDWQEDVILNELWFGGFRLMSDQEKVEVGDLTNAPILTDIDEDDLDTDLNSRSWIYIQYMSTWWIKDLLENGNIVLKARKNV